MVRTAKATLLGAIGLLALTVSALLYPSPPASAEDPEEISDPIPLVAVGDMGVCDSSASMAVSALMDQAAGEIVALGDLAYPDGSSSNFAECFDPIFGRHKDRILPVAGNHEYFTADAAGFAEYFGAAAGIPGEFWFAEQRGNWQIIVLNSNCTKVDCSQGSPQYEWLEQVLAASPSDICRAVAFHHPRWTSYRLYSSNLAVDPMLRLVAGAGTDLVLSGHAHHYERFEQQNPDAELDADNGFHHFVVGTGGVGLRPTTFVATNSAIRLQSHGILELSLGDVDFGWAFRSIDGSILDEGTDACVNAPPPAPEPAPAPEPTPDPEPEPITPPATEDPQLYRLYLAVFLREPDAAGMAYWVAQRQDNRPLRDIASFFAESPEFIARYGDRSDAEFVDLIYRNVLGRPPDDGGLSYWQNQLSAGMTRGELVVNFSESSEFIAATGF